MSRRRAARRRPRPGAAARRLALALLLPLLLLLAVPAHADRGAPVIVDTDLAADDARALALLLTAPHGHVVAVVTSDGVSPPAEAATNVCRILRFLNQPAVAVGIGRTLAAPPPPFRRNATELDWTKLGEPMFPPGGLLPAAHLIRLLLRAAPEGVLYLALGPLSNLADALEGAPELTNRIRLVLWAGAPPDRASASWNATRDPEALRKIAAAGLRVDLIRWPDEAAAPVVDSALLDELAAVNRPAADLILRLHRNGRGAELLGARHLRLWDDLVALRFLDPTLGTLVPVAGQPGWQQLVGVDPTAMPRAWVAALRQAAPRATVILAEFPHDPEDLLPDVRRLVSELLARHGFEEWKATVLTSELHRHLGTYSIVGAKMGLRARERLRADLDELRVESHAGLQPPLSCLNDGLQVATGASLGRGTITVRTGEPAACEAVFVRGDRRLRLRLKPEIARRIREDLTALEKKHGGLTPAYFAEVRTVSLQHWLHFDRNTMFDEVEEPAAAHP